MSELDLIYFILISCLSFSLSFSFFLSFSSHFHPFLNLGFRVRVSHDITQLYDTEKVLEEMMLYNMTTTCWPCEKHMYFRVG